MNESKKRGGRPRVGDVVSIALDEAGTTAYAVVLEKSQFAFFDGRNASEIDEVIRQAPMFYVSVMNSAVTTGRWPFVTARPERVAALKAPPTFIQDPINPEKFQIYDAGIMRPATRAECSALERTAVWDAEHVEDRIRDQYAGRENKWLLSLQIDAI
ncbi:MAG: Imm26 family immunity protein [Luteibacter sp.]|jgi:hypothetical protein|uniref:Imm26 family immunity protein n=1 Tax=Luteibacter TaxID=242605 RepID=UPI00068CEF68|nr:MULTISPECIES: Imm26 family immunity protein [unclassified Luteibacter]MDQ7994259.1 hypothetical protein [Luteibacter sp.]MDQ8048560.1 hypothetical protein [Luteibacter sp.]MDR6642249.1 hypothetical protein [Luteibacter sp. 1214]